MKLRFNARNRVGIGPVKSDGTADGVRPIVIRVIIIATEGLGFCGSASMKSSVRPMRRFRIAVMSAAGSVCLTLSTNAFHPAISALASSWRLLVIKVSSYDGSFHFAGERGRSVDCRLQIGDHVLRHGLALAIRIGVGAMSKSDAHFLQSQCASQRFVGSRSCVNGSEGYYAAALVVQTCQRFMASLAQREPGQMSGCSLFIEPPKQVLISIQRRAQLCLLP